MQLESPARTTAPASFVVANDATALDRILRPEANVCVWRRTLPSRLAAALERLARTVVHDVAKRVSPNVASTSALFAGLPIEESLLDAWTADVALLVGGFGKIVGTKGVRASLASVATNKCRKFHTDYKTVRLVCTYAGPGTEWVDDRDADRTAMGHEEACIDAANARIVRSGSRIRRAGAGDVVLLKGELFEGNRGRGAVHRSPPIEASGERRLVLTLDTV